MGATMQYSSDLPAVEIVEDEFLDLEQILIGDCDASETSYSIHDGDTTYEFASADAVLDDPTVPNFVREFDMAVECTQGSAEIHADNSANTKLEVSLYGRESWVKQKRSDVEMFFENKADDVRTFLDRNLGLEIVAVLVAGGVSYLLYWFGIGAWWGIVNMSDVTRIALAALVVTAASRRVFNRFYPYVQIVFKSEKELFPFLRKLAYVIGLASALISISIVLVN